MSKRIAIFHDYFTAIGGGEKLMLTLAKWLGADIITTDADFERIKKLGFENVNVIELGKNPRIPGLKQISATIKFLTCKFSNKYDFFILSGNWAHYASLCHHPSLYYCHTPVRAFYDLRNDYLRKQKRLKKFIFYLWSFLHSKFDRYSIKRVDKIVVNSRNVQNRVKKYYSRESEIVHPSVPTTRYHFDFIGDFWLAVSRLYPHKRIELQLEIFRKLQNEKLKIVGWYDRGSEGEKYVQGLKLPPNAEFLGEVDEKELIKLYARCKACITTAQDEDFGMTPLEAMASGKVVLATDEGGYRETIIDGKTGFLLPPVAEAFAKKIKELDKNKLERMKEDCMARAKEFDEKIFIQKMKELTD